MHDHPVIDVVLGIGLLAFLKLNHAMLTYDHLKISEMPCISRARPIKDLSESLEVTGTLECEKSRTLLASEVR